MDEVLETGKLPLKTEKFRMNDDISSLFKSVKEFQTQVGLTGQIEKDCIEAKKINDGNFISKILESNTIKRFSAKNKIICYKLFLWSMFKLSLIASKRMLKPKQNRRLYDCIARIKVLELSLRKAHLSNMSNETYQTRVTLLRTAESARNVLQDLNIKDNPNQKQQEDSEAEMKVELEKLTRLYKVWEFWYKSQTKGLKRQINTLFLVLNTRLVPVGIRERMIEIIQQSIFRKMLQNQYDKFRSIYADAFDLRFYNTSSISTNIILPENFDITSYSNKEGIGVSLTRQEIIDMYFPLVKDNYISRETDILDFAYAITGHPASHKKAFQKVCWTGRKKQSLAFFLGMLFSRLKGRHWYWNAAPDYFTFNGYSFTNQQMSSQFGTYSTHKSKRTNKDWETLSKITGFAE